MRAGDLIDGRFEIVEAIGSGGMGTVYSAVDRVAGELVAVKLLRSPHPDMEARFAAEARALAALEHPHIVRYITHARTPRGEPYLVMEWIDGEDLVKRLARGPMSIAESLDLARRIASALSAAHGLGVVHRDIKPSNIFLPGGSTAKVKLIDFGVARMRDATAQLTQTGKILGTPGYIAPEQTKGCAPDPRADVFSLGCVLFECLTGRPAFQGVHVLALLAKLLMDDPPRVDEIIPEAPADLADLVARMLSKDPAGRPADGAALVLDLVALNTGSQAHRPRKKREPDSITRVEKRLVSVVTVAADSPVWVSGSADTMPSRGLPATLLAQIRRALEPLGAKVEELANGAFVALLVGERSPTDRAAMAARSAIRMRALLPEAPIVLITGRSDPAGRLPVGEILERAAALLDEVRPRAGAAHPSPAPIHIDDVTRALLDVRFEVVDEDGRAVLRSEREVGGEARTLLGRPSPFVGREREFSQLCSLVESGIGDSSAEAIMVTGPAGLGKSRVRYELVRWLRGRFDDPAIGVGRGDSISAGSAFAMLGAVFRSSIPIAAGEPASEQREKLSHAVDFFVPEGDRRRVTEFLGEMLGVPFPGDDSPVLRVARQNASIMAVQIQGAYISFIRAVANAHPTILVLEDVQWGDAPSLKLIDAALRELDEKPFVVIAFARPEVDATFPRLWATRRRTDIRLGALPRRASMSLVHDALGPAADPQVIASVVDRAAGNAFYLEELTRAVAEGRGQSLPETVLGMAEARLAALNPEARRLLRAASVFGEVFWEAGVARLLGDTTPEANKEMIADLVSREVIVRRFERRYAGQEELAFRHSLLREGAYAALPDRDRAVGHKLAAEWLELSGERDPKVLAEHFERGGEPARAARYHLKAAELAREGNDYRAAIDLTDRAIAAGGDRALLADAWALRADSAFWNAEPGQAVLSAEKALAIAAPGSRADCRALGCAISGALFSGRVGLVDATLDRLLETDPEEGAVDLLAAGFNSALMYLVSTAQRGRIEQCLQRLAAVTKGAADREPLVAAWVAYIHATQARTVTHDFWSALNLDREAATQFERAGAIGYLPYVTIAIAQDQSLLGLYAAAEETLSAAIQEAQTTSIPSLLGSYFHAFMLLQRGDLDRAHRQAVEMMTVAESRRDRLLWLVSGVLVAESALRRGQIDEAERAARILDDDARKLPYHSLLHATVLAQIRLRQGRAAEAVEIADRAIALGRSFGMTNHLRDVALRLVHAEALLAAGREDAAHDAIRRSRDALSARSRAIPDERVRRAFLEAVPENARTIALAEEWLGAPVE